MTDWQSMETAPNEALNSASRISRETADILERRSFVLRYSSPMSSRLQSATSITHLRPYVANAPRGVSYD